MAEDLPDYEASIGSMWLSILIPSVLISAIGHALFGVATICRLVLHDAKALFVPVLYFAIGAVYCFLCSAPLAFALAMVHYSLGGGINNVELGFYVASLVLLAFFYSAGRVPNLYAM